MGRLQNNPSIGWVHPKSTHAHPLAWGQTGSAWGQKEPNHVPEQNQFVFFDWCWTIGFNLNPTVHSHETLWDSLCTLWFVGLANYQGKDIVFRFIIEYSSLMDFGH